MYELPSSSVYPDVVRLAGGADAVVKLARKEFRPGARWKHCTSPTSRLPQDPNHQEL